jgi:RimJ/RimL family protein N-acetyltransferase
MDVDTRHERTILHKSHQISRVYAYVRSSPHARHSAGLAVIVRRAERADAEAFAAVVAAVAEENRWIATQPPVDVAEFAARVRWSMEDGDVFWVLVDDERVVGTLGLHSTRVDGVGALGMCVLAESRGAGGGRLLMDAVMEHVGRAQHLHKVELEVWPDNERAIALYKSCGFEVEGLRRDHYRRMDGSLRSSIVMALLLDS